MRLSRPRSLLLSLVLVLAAGLTAGDGLPRHGQPDLLRILAGSELADMHPILADAARATGVTVELDYASTLDATQRVAAGEADGAYDAIWLSTNRYLQMFSQGLAKTDASARIMSSPVVLGIRSEAAARLSSPVTWASIAQAAADGELTFGMSDPARSNAATSALVSVATSTADTGAALRRRDIPQTTPRLRALFHAQNLTAASTEEVTEKYASGQASGVDGLIAYESELLALNASGRLAEPLTLLYPTDGVVTATYPLTLLASASDEAKDAFGRLVDYLQTPQVQQKIREVTWRRPRGAQTNLLELPFPATYDVIDDLVATYQGTVRRPARTVYLLDVSGSMAGTRIEALRQALATLTTGPLLSDEQITLLPFSTAPGTPSTFDIPADRPELALEKVRVAADALSPQGQTAVYDALAAAYQLIGRPDPDRITTVVLLTDGENNHGSTLETFTTLYRTLPDAPPVLPILFGESDSAEMRQLANLTGGYTFDGRTQSLSEVLARIRASR